MQLNKLNLLKYMGELEQNPLQAVSIYSNFNYYSLAWHFTSSESTRNYRRFGNDALANTQRL